MKKKVLAMSVLAAISSQAGAFQFDTGDDWNIRWDNSFKANLMSRTHKASDSVVAPGYGIGRAGSTERLQDDPDYSVNRKAGGIVSSRVDVLSELDVIWKQDFGFRISGSAWYDPSYENSDNPKSGTLPNGLPYDYSWGMLSVKPGEYNNAAEDLHYKGGELLDAFVFGNWNIGDNSALGIRAGRHTIYWGQSLLPGGAITGIAGSMAAIDLAKGFSVPGSEVRELFLPDNKVSMVFQATDNLTLSGYYAFEHQIHRLPAAGTFLSPLEILTEDSEFLTFVPGVGGGLRTGFRVVDDKIEDSGEFGIKLGYTFDSLGVETDLVYINGSDRSTSGIYASLGGLDPDKTAQWRKPWDEGGSNANVIGQYGWVYKNDITTYGISLAKSAFDISWGMDITYKQDAALNPEFNASLQGTSGSGAQPGDWSPSDYPGAVGDVWGVVANGLGLLNSDWGLWDGGNWILEVTASWLDDYVDNEQYANIRMHKGRVTTQVAYNFKPTWYQMFPGWDMSLPLSISYAIDGEQPPLSNVTQEELGNYSLGVEFLVKETWTLTTKYNAFFGPMDNGTSGRLRDRDNVTLTVKRTF